MTDDSDYWKNYWSLLDTRALDGLLSFDLENQDIDAQLGPNELFEDAAPYDSTNSMNFNSLLLSKINESLPVMCSDNSIAVNTIIKYEDELPDESLAPIDVSLFSSSKFDAPSPVMSPDSVQPSETLVRSPMFDAPSPVMHSYSMNIQSVVPSSMFDTPSPVRSPDSVNVELLVPSSMASRSPTLPRSSYFASQPSTSTASSSFAPRKWPGEFNFKIDFPHHEKSTRSVPWIFSPEKNKLYVKIDHPCPINFSVNRSLDNDYSIRAMAFYSTVEHASEAVRRCHNHSHEDKRKNKEHLIKYSSEVSKATYHEDCKTKQHSVLVPYENPPSGEEFSTFVYKFTCFSSCIGGPNRRPMAISFSLERRGEVVGCCTVNIKICACPGRDYANECGEKKSSSNKRKSPEEEIKSEEQELIFLIPTKGKNICTKSRKCWEFLKEMKNLYESATPDMRKSLINKFLGNSDSDSN